MSEKKRSLGLGNPIVVLAALTLIATLATIGLHLAGQTAWAVGVGTFTFFLLLALLVATTAVVVSWWSATLMQRGAELALRSQESDDRRDIVLVKSIADLTRTLLRQGQPQYPALPLPSQQQEWLPPLNEFSDVIDGESKEVN